MNHQGHRKSWSIRTQLLLAVNLTLGTVILVLLGLRYQREMEQVVTEKTASLNDEAIAIHAALLHLSREHTTGFAQRYIDTVCRQMCESRSPDHHIVVRRKGLVLQAGHHESNTNAILEVMNMKSAGTSPTTRGDVGGQTLIVGTYSSAGIDIFTAQSLSTIRRAVRRDILLQLGVIAGLGILAAAIVNLVLLRFVNSPLHTLVQTVEQIGSGVFGGEASKPGSREMDQITDAVNAMSQSLERHERERRRRLRTAYEIQQHLLPHGQKIPGFVSAHHFEPADEVAGDYFDFLRLKDGSWLICIADVSGHGVPAAMGVAMLKMLLVVASERDQVDPASILTFVNQRFCESTLPEQFASMFLGRWQPRERQLDYASAGHQSPLLLNHRGEMKRLPSTGLLLGIDVGAEWSLQSARLEPGDRLLAFSDGAIEARSESGGLFGMRRLSAWFSKFAVNSPIEAVAQVAERISEHRNGHPAEDDLTLLVLEAVDPDQATGKESQRSQATAA